MRILWQAWDSFRAGWELEGTQAALGPSPCIN